MKILEKQIKLIEDHGKQLVESNELIKKDFNIDRDGVSLDEQKIIFNELVDDKSHEFQNLKNEINPINLAYKYRTKGRSPKYFGNYQDLIKLFKDLKDGNINPKEVLKDQINFKSDLDKIKKEIKKQNQKIK